MTEARPQSVPAHPHAAASGSARRRYLTIVFSDLTGSTRLAGGMEAEDYAQLLDPVRRAYQEVIPKFGGTMVQISGDGLLAVFGYPEADETDGRMATMAALELHARVRSLDSGHSLRLHTGIHSGLVLVDEGDAVRGRLELLGSATNIASRLATAAQADEIVVSEATLGPDRGMFQTSERLYLNLKGKEKPIAAFRVLDRAPEGTRYAARERGGLNPFVGRREEFQRLAEVIERVTAGGTRFISVVGPPGVGKTRLVGELLARHSDGLQVYRGECDSRLGAEPLQPFLQILRSAFGISQATTGSSMESIQGTMGRLGADLAGHGDVLLRLLAPAEAGARRRPPSAASVAAALRALFALLAEGKPLALFIDDWQWADDASRKLLQGLREMAWPSLLILLTTRTEGLTEPFDTFERLDVTPFDPEEATTAVRNVLPAADPFLVGDICGAAGGNPLFIEELCHSVAYGEQDFRTHEGSGWLDILIESRFARLPDAQADLLATAAVIGNTIPTSLLERTTGCRKDDPLVRALAEEDFIFPGERAGTLRFKHGITRDVIYDSVGLRERRALHLRIAEALRQEPATVEEDVEALAYHYGAGGDAGRGAHYSELAGDKAFAAAALDRAQHQYRAALDALDRMPQTAETVRSWDRVVRRFGLACVFDPSPNQLPVFEQAVERAAAREEGRTQALAEYWLGYIHFALGHSLQAATHCQRGLEAAASLGDDGLTAQIRALLGQAMTMASRYDQAIILLDQAIAAMRQDPVGYGTQIGLAYSLSCKGFALADLGRFAEARANFDEAVALAGTEHVVEASVLSNYNAAWLWQGRMEDAARIAADAQRVSARVRTLYMFARNRSAEAYARWALTGDEAAIDLLVEATGWLEQSGRELCLSLNYGWLAEIMAASRMQNQARHYAARALRRARRHDKLGEAMAYRALATLSSYSGDHKRSDRYLERAMRSATGRSSRHELAATQLRAAELLLARGDRDQALDLLRDAEVAFAEMEMDRHSERAVRLRAAAAHPSVGRSGPDPATPAS